MNDARESRYGAWIGSRSEAQMRDRHRSRFLGVVDEVPLCEQIRLVTDDLDRILVGAYGAIGAEAVEQRPHGARWLDLDSLIDRQRQGGHVVGDTDGEMLRW